MFSWELSRNFRIQNYSFRKKQACFLVVIMSLRPACAGTQTGTPQRMKTPPIPQPWGEQHTPRIGGGGLFSGETSPPSCATLSFSPSPTRGGGGLADHLVGQPGVRSYFQGSGNVRKRLFALFIAISIVGPMASCSGGGVTPTALQSFAPSVVATLTVLPRDLEGAAETAGFGGIIVYQAIESPAGTFDAAYAGILPPGKCIDPRSPGLTAAQRQTAIADLTVLARSLAGNGFSPYEVKVVSPSVVMTTNGDIVLLAALPGPKGSNSLIGFVNARGKAYLVHKSKALNGILASWIVGQGASAVSKRAQAMVKLMPSGRLAIFLVVSRLEASLKSVFEPSTSPYLILDSEGHWVLSPSWYRGMPVELWSALAVSHFLDNSYFLSPQLTAAMATFEARHALMRMYPEKGVDGSRSMHLFSVDRSGQVIRNPNPYLVFNLKRRRWEPPRGWFDGLIIQEARPGTLDRKALREKLDYALSLDSRLCDMFFGLTDPNTAVWRVVYDAGRGGGTWTYHYDPHTLLLGTGFFRYQRNYRPPLSAEEYWSVIGIFGVEGVLRYFAYREDLNEEIYFQQKPPFDADSVANAFAAKYFAVWLSQSPQLSYKLSREKLQAYADNFSWITAATTTFVDDVVKAIHGGADLGAVKTAYPEQSAVIDALVDYAHFLNEVDAKYR